MTVPNVVLVRCLLLSFIRSLEAEEGWDWRETEDA